MNPVRWGFILSFQKWNPTSEREKTVREKHLQIFSVTYGGSTPGSTSY